MSHIKSITNKSHLVPIQKIVVRDGQTFLQTFYVSPEEASKHDSSRTFHSAEAFKEFCRKLSTEQRQEIIAFAEQVGITWKRQPQFNTDWMRCAMAINAHLKSGQPFTLPPFKAVNDKASKTAQPKAKDDKPKASSSVEGTFKTRDEFKAFIKKLTTEQRQFIVEDALKQGITWTRVDKPATDWMRCAMAIGAHIEKGNTYTIGKQADPKDRFKPVLKPDAKLQQGSPIPPQPQPEQKPEQKPEPTPAAPTQSTPSKPKIDELFEKAGLQTRVENGNYIVGAGVKTIKNKWGHDEIAPGHLRFVDIMPKPQFGQGNWIKLDSAFLDKEKLKGFGARFEPTEKKWYIPFKEFVRTAVAFKNLEIASKIYPTMKAVMEKVPNVDQLLNSSQPPINNNDDIDISDFKMPAGMNPALKLYDHQKKGVKFAIQNRKAILGLAVGLGKTLTSITAAKELINRGEVKRVVVISPASVKFNWKQEIENFSDMKACVLESSDLRGNKADAKWKEAEKSQIIIVNYDMIRKPEIREKLQQLAPDCVIADEAHKLKNDTQQTKGFKETWKNAKYKWFLTATPFPNGQPKETYNMLAHLRPDKVGSWKRDFGREFVVWESAGRFGAKAVMLKNLDKLKAKMSDVVFIRTHNSPDVNSSLPKERHTTYNLEMTPEQKKMYKAIADDIVSEIKNLEKAGIKASAPVLLAKMKRLEQVAIDPDMLKEDSSKVDLNKLYPKEEWAVNTITEHLQDPDNRGVVLFCDMKLPLDKVRQGLINNGLDPKKIAYITGDVKPEERTKIQDKMKTGEVQVVLCTNAAEEGVNLQHGAHTLIHLDVPWVPKSITQREGRVLRQGQTSDYANFLTPIMAGTVEDTKRSKLGIKVSTIEELLGKGSSGSAAGNVASDTSAEKLTLDDIKAILGVK